LALLARIRAGGDPLAERDRQRGAITVAQLIDAFDHQHVSAHCKPNTASAHHVALSRLREAHGALPAVELTRAHVTSMHRDMGDTPYSANRFQAVVVSLFSWAQRQGLVPEGHANPASGIKRFKEQVRERLLSVDELARLGAALRETDIDPFVVAAIRLLILTGARLREILHAQWQHVDLERGAIFLPDSKTGKKPIYLNTAALAILAKLPRFEDNPHIIPGSRAGQPRSDLNKPWSTVTKAAGLDGLRIHDLRHGFASIGAAASLGLPIIGKLLGHSQAATTQRYAHLAADPMISAANVIGATIAAAMGDGHDLR
jgi:integrase